MKLILRVVDPMKEIHVAAIILCVVQYLLGCHVVLLELVAVMTPM